MNDCKMCKLTRGPNAQSFNFAEAVWMIENRFELGLCYQCGNFFKKILETSLKEEGIGQADFTGLHTGNDGRPSNDV